MGILDTFNKKPDELEEVLPNDLTKEDEFLTGTEVCRMLHVSDRALLNWEKTGKLKAYRLTTSDPRVEGPGKANQARGKRFLLRDIKKLFAESLA